MRKFIFPDGGKREKFSIYNKCVGRRIHPGLEEAETMLDCGRAQRACTQGTHPHPVPEKGRTPARVPLRETSGLSIRQLFLLRAKKACFCFFISS